MRVTNPARERVMDAIGLDDDQMLLIEELAERFIADMQDRASSPVTVVVTLLYILQLVKAKTQGRNLSEVLRALNATCGLAMADAARYHAQRIHDAIETRPPPDGATERIIQ